MKRTLTSVLGASVLAATIAVPVMAQSGGSGNACTPGSRDYGRGGDLYAFGLTRDQRLVCFDEDDPQDADRIGRIRGLVTDSSIVGIDVRPANGRLYGLGDQGGVYVLDPMTAQATLSSRLTMPLTGDEFGVDFNPVVDRLRIVGDDGQNLRVNVDDGTTMMDGVLNYVGPPPVSPATGVTAAAYINNDADPNTLTVLYDIDTQLDQLVIQAPPNSGTLNPVAKIAVNAGLRTGFDIHSKIRNGTTVQLRALAVVRADGESRVYRIRLFNGSLDFQGEFRDRDRVVDIAIPLDQL